VDFGEVLGAAELLIEEFCRFAACKMEKNGKNNDEAGKVGKYLVETAPRVDELVQWQAMESNCRLQWLGWSNPSFGSENGKNSEPELYKWTNENDPKRSFACFLYKNVILALFRDDISMTSSAGPRYGWVTW